MIFEISCCEQNEVATTHQIPHGFPDLWRSPGSLALAGTINPLSNGVVNGKDAAAVSHAAAPISGRLVHPGAPRERLQESRKCHNRT